MTPATPLLERRAAARPAASILRTALALSAGLLVASCSGGATPELDVAGDTPVATDIAQDTAAPPDAGDAAPGMDAALDASLDAPSDAAADVRGDAPTDVLRDDVQFTIFPPYRAVYVDNFDAILADSARTTALLEWVQRNTLNVLTLYDLGTVLTTPALTARLPNFLRTARTMYGVETIVAVGGRGTTFATTYRAYEDSHTDVRERFDGYNLEREWWNSDGSFAQYTTDLMGMRTAAMGSTPAHTAEEYVGWFMDPLGSATESHIAQTLVQYSDRTLVHDYRTAPDFAYTQPRLAALGQAAMSAGRTYDVVVIFSAEATRRGDPNNFMGDYFSTTSGNHTFRDAFEDYRRMFNSTPFTGRSNLRLVGFQIFAYSQAAWARP